MINNRPVLESSIIKIFDDKQEASSGEREREERERENSITLFNTYLILRSSLGDSFRFL